MLHVNVDRYHTTNRTATTNGPISLAGAAGLGKYGYGNEFTVMERISGTVLMFGGTLTVFYIPFFQLFGQRFSVAVFYSSDNETITTTTSAQIRSIWDSSYWGHSQTTLTGSWLSPSPSLTDLLHKLMEYHFKMYVVSKIRSLTEKRSLHQRPEFNYSRTFVYHCYFSTTKILSQ